jgi:hypothetical protein
LLAFFPLSSANLRPLPPLSLLPLLSPPPPLLVPVVLLLLPLALPVLPPGDPTTVDGSSKSRALAGYRSTLKILAAYLPAHPHTKYSKVAIN